MTIDPKAVEAACKAFQSVWSNVPDEERARWPDDYDVAEIGEVEMCMTASLEAAAPFIRAQATQAELREAFEAGYRHCIGESMQISSRLILNPDSPHQTCEEAFQEYLRDYGPRNLIPAETKELPQ